MGFLIAPILASDDFDWALMDITGHPPQDVFTTNLVISLNICGITGNTGCTPAGVSNINCEGNTDPYNIMPLLVAGHDYLLMVTNWSNSGQGYDLSFSGGTADITNPQIPQITSASVVGCNGAQVKINFSQDLLCSSLSATGSEFSLTSGPLQINTISSVCNSASSTFTELTLTLQNPLPPGNYQLVVNTGTDLNTLFNVCNVPIATGPSVSFSVPSPLPPVINNVSFTGCAPNILKVALSKPILCSSISPTGSEFQITPGNPTISSVVSACAPGTNYTDTIQIILQNRLPFGNYQVTVGTGLDGNTFMDTCANAMVIGTQIPLVINQTTTAPVIQSVVFDECKPFLVTVNFDKPVACNSIDGSEFSITPGSHSILNIAHSCTGSVGYTSQVVIRLSNNLPAGNFNVNVNTGTDGNTLSDSCFSFMPSNYTKAFTTTQAPAPTYDSLQYDHCTPSEIKIFYSKAIDCGSVFAPGIEFYITGPTPVNILSVSGNPATCSTGYSNWLLLHLSQPINNLGTYVLHNRWSGDGNSVLDTCYAAQDTTETISFNVLGKPSAAFNDQVRWGCVEDTIVLSHPGGNGINSWQWNFSDNTSASGQSVSHTFPDSTIIASVQLIVSNGICTDTLQRSYPLHNVFNADFTVSADTICVNTNLNFTNNSTGNNLQYLWQFGDNTTFAGQVPSPHVYAASNNFNINLIATDNHGCSDTAVKSINVTKVPVVDFTGLNNQYCTGDTISLVANLQGNIDSYTWNNGNGLSISDHPAANFVYDYQSDYSISLEATDRFCGLFKKDSLVKIYRVPRFGLGEDKTLCPGLSIKLGSMTVPGYAYLWGNGETVSEIITGPQTGTYSLTINNHGCIASDNIYVEVLDHCLIKVPGAFTPNRDGLNDLLKAINAELATSFSLKVYNRFGQLMFFTRDPLAGWDGVYRGNPQDSGTYVWQLSYIDPVSKKPVYEKGTSILIR